MSSILTYSSNEYEFEYLKTMFFLGQNLFVVNAGHEPGADLGPVISPESKQRIIDLVESGVKEGAELVLDGRDVVVPG